jgi:type IV pilus assembly protein PilB
MNSGIGKILLQGNFILNESELSLISQNAIEHSESIITSTVKFKKLNHKIIANYIAQKFQLPYLDLDYFDTTQLPADLDIKLLDSTKILPLKKTNTTIYVATSDPTNHFITDIKFHSNVNSMNVIIVEENKLNSIIGKYLKTKEVAINTGEFDNIEFESTDDAEEREDAAAAAIEDSPIVKLIQEILIEAIKTKVSDIHFEPYEKTYRVRYRLDGVLYETKKIPPGLKDKISARIKVVSNLDISEKRIPQDGRFKLKLSKEKSIDFRVSTLPTLWGEKIVMRILDSSAAALNIDKLGYDEQQKKTLIDAIRRPYGMVLVTGPTGSGKTVSLYSCINLLNNEDINISTVEDPAEINLPGVNQVNVNDKVGLSFASALKSFLRQDPDAILVGEIRDLETADIAIKAAQTGHMVLSTLHTNDAPKTITRLLNMGVKPFNIASSVVLITAQRLVRRLCPHCKKQEDLPEKVLRESGFTDHIMEGYGKSWHIYRPVGCEECNMKGYSGRVGIYQVMPVTEEIRRIILREGNDIEIADEARKNGVYGLREAGLIKVKEGITSLEEVLGATNVD